MFATMELALNAQTRNFQPGTADKMGDLESGEQKCVDIHLDPFPDHITDLIRSVLFICATQDSSEK